MRVIYAYTKVFDEALEALYAEGYPIEMVDVSSDDESYYRLFSDLWHSGETFINVEHDMVIYPGMIQELVACGHEHCGGVYWLYGSYGSWHGVVKYEGSLTKRLPLLPESIQRRHWGSLDSAFLNHLRLLGEPETHYHLPVIRHLVPKIVPGILENAFYQCIQCGANLDMTRAFNENPLHCDACGGETLIPIPDRTATDITL